MRARRRAPPRPPPPPPHRPTRRSAPSPPPEDEEPELELGGGGGGEERLDSSAAAAPYYYPAVEDLDLFLSRLYRYWESRGLAPALAARAANLAALALTLCISFFLLYCVDYGALCAAACLRLPPGAPGACSIVAAAVRRPGGAPAGAARALGAAYLLALAAYAALAAVRFRWVLPGLRLGLGLGLGLLGVQGVFGAVSLAPRCAADPTAPRRALNHSHPPRPAPPTPAPTAQAHLAAEAPALLETRRFAARCLGYSDAALRAAPWPEVAARLVGAQAAAARLCRARDLTEWDVAAALTRKEDFLTALLDAGALALAPPWRARAPLLTRSLEWSLHWCGWEGSGCRGPVGALRSLLTPQ